MRRIHSCPDLYRSSDAGTPPNATMILSPVASRRTSFSGPLSRPQSRGASTRALPIESFAQNIVSDVAMELAIPAPAIIKGQCHLLYGFPKDVLESADDEAIPPIQRLGEEHPGEDPVMDFAFCAATPTEAPERIERPRLVQRGYYVERMIERGKEERVYALLRTIRRQRRKESLFEPGSILPS